MGVTWSPFVSLFSFSSVLAREGAGRGVVELPPMALTQNCRRDLPRRGETAGSREVLGYSTPCIPVPASLLLTTFKSRQEGNVILMRRPPASLPTCLSICPLCTCFVSFSLTYLVNLLDACEGERWSGGWLGVSNEVGS